MKIIKDLGYTDLDGKYKTKKYFVVAECPTCKSHVTIRKDHKTQICKSCVGKKNIATKTKQALTVVAKQEQHCTKCKLLKPLSSFHKDKTKLSGFRAVCKSCRYELEKDKNALYLKTLNGKASSANRKNKRRALINSSSDNSITTPLLMKKREEQNHKCYYCGLPFDYTTKRSVHLDHVIPLSKGGIHSITNVVWSCQKCNLLKSNKTT